MLRKKLFKPTMRQTTQCTYTVESNMLLSGWGFKGENYGKGRWTQMQLHRRQDKENKRRAFIKQKLNAKNPPKQTKWDERQSSKTKPARQSSNKRKQQDKVQIKNQSSTQTWKTQNQNIPNRGQGRTGAWTYKDKPRQ